MSYSDSPWPKGSVVLSASQIDNALDCTRKWAFKRVFRLQEPRKTGSDPRTLGEVTHEVLARYLEADHLGRDRTTSKPVELYPEGWETVVSKFGFDKGLPRSIGIGEQAIVQTLVSKAIEQGVVERLKDGKVEAPFAREILPSTDDLPAVWISGSIDYLLPAEVQDHKTAKLKKYLKTAKALQKSPQMLIYAWEVLQRCRDQGTPIPPKVTIRHNGLVKDPNNLLVRRTPAQLSRAQIDTYWTSTVLPLAEKLRDLKVKKPDWHKIPEPEKQGPCNAYGGCKFMSICIGRETVERYRIRVEKNNKKLSVCRTDSVESPSSQQDRKEGITMNMAEKIAEKKAQKAALAGASNKTPTNTKPPEPKPPEAVPPKVDVVPTTGDRPPWADPNCKACTGLGFNTKLNACRICRMRAKKSGKPSPDSFEIVATDGEVCWSNGEIEGMLQFGEVKAEEKTEAPVVEEETPAVEEETPAAESTQESDSEQTEPKDTKEESTPAPQAKRGRGRPRKGFTLLIGCVAIKGTGKVGSGKGVVQLDDVLRRIRDTVAEANGVESFYDLDTFQRRDKVVAAISVVIEELGTDYVLATRKGSVLEREVISALRPFAATVIEALA